VRRWLPIFLLCIACQAQYAPLAIDFEAPDSTAGTAYTTFLLNELPFLSGIAPGSTHALGLGQVYWSDLDNCSSTAPCVADNVAPCSTMGTNCYDWAAIDTDMMAYIGATVGVLGTFNNGCAGGRACKIILIINAEQDSGQGVTTVPTYVFSSTWAANAPGGPYPLQDVAACKDWPGVVTGPSGPWPGNLPCTGTSGACNFTNSTQGVVWNAGLCTPVGAGAPSCSSMHGPFANMSGFPVVYEKPIQIAYQALISAIQLHYSSGGSGHGPTIAPYIAYIRIGMAAGGENNPGCVGVGAVSGGVLANTFWPGPKGLAAEPQCYTQCGYLTNWAGTAQNGLSCTNTAACTLDGLGSDGDGYVTAMDKFLGPLFSGSIRATTSSHGGPPGNTTQPYADAEALAASIVGVGFGMQSARISDQSTYVVGMPTTQNWVVNFARYAAPVHHLQAQSNGGANPEAANFGISTIACIGTVCTVNCTGSIGNNCSIYNGATVEIGGNSNNSYNGQQTVTGTANSSSFTFSSSDSSGGSGGQVWASDYWPSLFPFLTQHKTSSIELRACELDYAFGCSPLNLSCTANTSVLPCGGNPGPDASYTGALANFVNGIPTATSVITGRGQLIGKGITQ
jgi:hypothetical protein